MNLLGVGTVRVKWGSRASSGRAGSVGRPQPSTPRPREHRIVRRLAAGSGNQRRVFDCFRLRNSRAG